MKTFVMKTAAAVTGVAILAAGSPANAEELRLAHFVSPAHTVSAGVIQPLVEGVAADTDGELVINVYPGGELGANPADQYLRALQGVADITWGLQGYTSSQFPRSMIVEMPGALDEGTPGYEAFWRAYDEHLSGEFPGTVPLAVWTSEPSIFIMRGHDVRRPEDLEGLRIRVSGAMQSDMITEMGGTPVQMPAGEMYNALQTGLIDGILTGSSAVSDFRLDEVANSYTLGAALGRVSFFLVMNEERYNGLSDEHRAAIDAHSGEGLSRKGEEAWNAKADATIQSLREDPDATVIDLTDEEIAAFDEVLNPLRERLISQIDGGAEAHAAMTGQ